jgi:hypothetical protein
MFSTQGDTPSDQSLNIKKIVDQLRQMINLTLDHPELRVVTTFAAQNLEPVHDEAMASTVTKASRPGILNIFFIIFTSGKVPPMEH